MHDNEKPMMAKIPNISNQCSVSPTEGTIEFRLSDGKKQSEEGEKKTRKENKVEYT